MYIKNTKTDKNYQLLTLTFLSVFILTFILFHFFSRSIKLTYIILIADSAFGRASSVK